MTKMTDVPNPGSDAAYKLGCQCARIDNHYGAGFPWPDPDHPGEMKVSFWITDGCPLHCPKEEE
jgi:hypothetical protein